MELIGRLIRAAALTLVPSIAAAQFTSFVQPLCKTATDSVRAATVVAKKAKSDTAARIRLTNMREWVDSAAGLPRVRSVENDSAPQPRARPPAPPKDSTPAAAPAPAKPLTPTTPAPMPNNGARVSPIEPRPPIPVIPPVEASVDTSSFRNGARAPDTASVLPLAVVGGALAIVGGVWLMATGSEPPGA